MLNKALEHLLKNNIVVIILGALALWWYISELREDNALLRKDIQKLETEQKIQKKVDEDLKTRYKIYEHNNKELQELFKQTGVFHEVTF